MVQTVAAPEELSVIRKVAVSIAAALVLTVAVTLWTGMVQLRPASQPAAFPVVVVLARDVPLPTWLPIPVERQAQKGAPPSEQPNSQSQTQSQPAMFDSQNCGCYGAH
jgi:hypothetical protein